MVNSFQILTCHFKCEQKLQHLDLVQIWLTWRERESQAWPAVGKQWLPGVWGGQQCRSAGRCVRLLWWWMMSNEHINVKTQELLLELVNTSHIWSLDINQESEGNQCMYWGKKKKVSALHATLWQWHCEIVTPNLQANDQAAVEALMNRAAIVFLLLNQ